MNIEIRKSTSDEAARIIEINNIVWQDTYKDLLPAEVIERKRADAPKRITDWQKTIAENNNVFVAIVDGQIIGYNAYGPARNINYENCGEIYASYILKEYQGFKIGRKLAIACMEELQKQGFDKLVTRCLKGNIFNEFHKSIGGVFLKSEDHIIQDYPVKENLYIHESLENSLMMNKENR